MTSYGGTSPVDKNWNNADYEIKEQDRFLPIANVGRVMKAALPSHAKLSKESKECIQECVSEFISFITSQASDRCLRENRKTLNGEDVLWAMYTLGFENYSETLKIYLAKYRQYEQEQTLSKPPKRKKTRTKKIQDYDYDDEHNDIGEYEVGNIPSEVEGEYAEEGDIQDVDDDDDEDAYNLEYGQLMYANTQKTPNQSIHQTDQTHESKDVQQFSGHETDPQVHFRQSEHGVEMILKSSPFLEGSSRFPSN